MANVITEKAQQAKELWNKQEKKKKIWIISATVVVVLCIALLIFAMTRKNYAVLFSGMTSTEAGEVYNMLQDQGMDVKVRNDSTILVPEDKAEELRLNLSAQGYPKSGLNYDVFEKASSFGSTDMEKQVYLKFQLEQNITQTIKRLEKIQDATVMVTLAKDSQFALSGSGNTPASASVVVNLKNGQTLTQNEAQSIRNLVMRSVPNLTAENITLVDSNMQAYEDAGEVDTVYSGENLSLQKTVQNNLEEQLLKLLLPVFGQGKVSTSVNVRLNFDTKVTTSVTFEPPVEGEEQGLIVSMKELYETINGGAAADGTVGVDANGGAVTYPTTDGQTDGTYNKTTREFNAEINETKEQIEEAKGKIEELSVSVILDSDGTTDEVIQEVRNLVATAIGVEEENITVSRMPFKANQQQAEEAAAQQELLEKQQRSRLIRNILIGTVLALAAAAVIYLIWKKRKQAQAEALALAEVEQQRQGIDLMADEDLDISDLTSNKEPENTEKIKKLVQSNPEAVAQLLRNWLGDEYGR